jgi:hypothetical protein
VVRKFCILQTKIKIKKSRTAEHQWLMPVILAIWEAEIRRIMV